MVDQSKSIKSMKALGWTLCKFIMLFFVVTALTFQIITSAPGSFSEKQRYDHLQNSSRAAELPIEENVNKYGDWCFSLLKGHLGNSLKFKVKNTELIFESLIPSLLQFLMAFLITIALLFFIGLWAYSKKKSILRSLILIIFSSLPIVVVAIGLQLVFAVQGSLEWLPLTGYPSPGERTVGSVILYSVLPIMTYVVVLFSYFSFLIIQLVQEEQKKVYIMAAQAKGLSAFPLYSRHILKNIAPILISVGPQLFYFFLISTSLVEFMFNVPGVGWLMIQALQYRDLPLLMALVVFQYSVLFFLREVTSHWNVSFLKRVYGERV